MKKINLLIILAALAVHSSSIWASTSTPTEEMSEEASLRARIQALQVQNAADEQALRIAGLKAQLKAEEEKAALLTAQKKQLGEELNLPETTKEEKEQLLAEQKKQLEDDLNLPKTWEDIPYMEVKVQVWREYYPQIESTFDPRKSSTSSFIREASKILAKNSKKFKPAVSQINSSHTDVLKKHPSQWASLGLNEDTETHTNIARFLLDKIWLEAYQGKSGFKI